MVYCSFYMFYFLSSGGELLTLYITDLNICMKLFFAGTGKADLSDYDRGFDHTDTVHFIG